MTSHLTEELISTLMRLKGQTVYFFANTGNAGDGLIAHATHSLLDTLGISVIPYTNDKELSGETLIIGGGGNFVEGLYWDVADVLKKNLSNNKCIVLPHTVSGFRELLRHPNLTLFCREQISYQLAIAAGARNVFLAHDLAFSLPAELLAISKGRSGTGTLYALRYDGESNHRLPIPHGNVDLSKTWENKLWNDPILSKTVSESLVAFISLHREVVTDRLHVAILSALLGREVTMMPNSYFKNLAVFQHSIEKRFDNVRFINAENYLYESGLKDQAIEIAELQSERKQLKAELQDMQSSRSWMITKPLRAIAQLVRRVK